MRINIIGVGALGAHAANALLLTKVGLDLVLTDIDEDKEGEPCVNQKG